MFEFDGFEWDSNKVEINIWKYGVIFEEVIIVFYDDFVLFMLDLEYFFDEECFLLFGLSEKNWILVVVYCECD